MDSKDIKKYADLMRELDLTGLEINEEGKVLRLERELSRIIPEKSEKAENNGNIGKKEKIISDNILEVVSPIVGVFRAAPTENGEPYVKVGDHVNRGDTLCVIEAMKLMNEILAECNGTVCEVCVRDNQVIEYGTVLFRIER